MTTNSAWREPALILTFLLAPAVQTGLLVFADLDAGTQATWNGLAAAVAGLITAAMVARDRLVPAILGLGQALIAGATVWGWDLSTEESTAVSAFLALAVGAFTRTQVRARITDEGRPVLPAAA